MIHKQYGQILRVPHATRLVVSALVGRLPIGMTSLGLILLVRATTGSYGKAGVLTGAFALTAAVAAPIEGRAMDRFGLSRVLVPFALVHAASLALLAHAVTHDAPAAWAITWAALAGATQPSLAAAMRVMWSSMLGQGRSLQTAFSFESTAQEMIFIVGPLLASTLAASVSPVAPLLLAGATAVIGTLAFALAPPVRAWRGVRSDERHWLGSLVSRGVRALLVTSAFVACAFGMVEVGLTAFAEEMGNRSASGVLLSLWGVGSITGGLVFSARHWGGTPRGRFLVCLAVLAGSFVLVALPHSFAWMCVAIVGGGLAIAPWISCFYLLIDRLAPRGTMTESATWVSTGFAAGMAVGRSVAGAAIEARGAHAALAGAAVLLAMGLLAAWILRPALLTEDIASATIAQGQEA